MAKEVVVTQQGLKALEDELEHLKIVRRKEVAEKINTYETSILPYEDCCTIFVAKHPVTKPNVEVIRKSEEKLAEKIDQLFDEAIRSVETIIVK